MGFFNQVGALVLKDLRIMRANTKSSIMEILIPVVVGCAVGAFIMLIQYIQKHATEYTDVHYVEPFWYQNQTENFNWIGVIGTCHLAKNVLHYLTFGGDFHVVATEFADYAKMSAGYDAAIASKNYTNLYGVGITPGNVSLDDWSSSKHGFMGFAALFNEPGVQTNVVGRELSYQNIFMVVNLRAIFSSTGMTFLIYAYVPSLILSAGRLVEEKRDKIRESLKVMGMNDFGYVLANFVTGSIRMGFGSILISVVLAAFKAIEASAIIDVLAISFLFALSLITFAQIMPALFKESIWSNVMCIMILAGGAALCSISTGFAKPLQLVSCLLSPVAYYYSTLPYLSKGAVQLQTTTSEGIMMIVIDTVLYCLIGNYLYAINPGEFGVPKHPLFFLGFGKKTVSRNAGGNAGSLQGISTGADGNGDRVVLRNLMKYYGEQRHTPSVDNLNLSIQKKEIFALLGHNGAGKTTTISILTGMITPTSYDEASVDGFDIGSNMDKVRDAVGLCPQFDVLFNDLTARQHLEMFARIKGVEDPTARINDLMTRLELPDTKQVSSTFSGGTKRRLSVGNALVGNATLVFLDEPSSGMDPLSRRQMWDLLKEERDKGKTLVLTTHFMEEADYLGDRIAIMSRGKLFCCDTSQQLKQKYGVGYYLTLVKSQNNNDVEGAGKIVNAHIPEAELKSESSGEATFLLPVAALPNFGALLEEIEKALPTLGFHSYGLSMNSLEDVFVSISEKESAEHAANTANADVSTLNTKSVNGEEVEEIFKRAARIPAKERMVSHIKTVFGRKVTMFKRSRRMQTMILAFPILFIFMGFLITQPQVQSHHDAAASDVPDWYNIHVPFLNLRDHDANNRIRDEFKKVYQQAYPGATVNLYEISDYTDYALGTYLPLHSLSFVAGFKSPDMAFGFLPHSTQLSGKDKSVKYSLLINGKFTNAVIAKATAMFNAAIEAAAGNDGVFVDIKIGEHIAPTSAPGETLPPMPKPEKTYNVINLGIYMVIALVQLVANCAIPIADEIQRGVYNANRAHGMSTASYFIGNMLFDFMCCIFPFVLFIIGVFMKDIGGMQGGILVWIILAGLVFAVHVVLQAWVIVTYLPSLRPVTYTGILHSFNLMCLALPYLIVVILQSTKFPGWHDLKPFILASTPAASWYHIMDNASDLTKSNTHAGYVWTFSGFATGWSFLSLIFELALPIFLIYRFAMDRVQGVTLPKFMRKLQGGGHAAGSPKKKVSGEEQPLLAGNQSMTNIAVEKEDDDVATERARVEGNPNDNMVAAVHLRKEFGVVDPKVAVKDLSLGIRRGECFGLLGPNGAGKSTTCKLILRDLMPTKGEVLFPNCGIQPDMGIDERNLHTRLGVCQQGNTLWDFLDNREHMDQYLRLRLATAYKPEDWTEYIDNAIKKVYLEPDTKPSGGYSGGMKRKLTVCLAMYTGAINIFLDEPSTGMDPFSRRALWKVILEALSDHRCVLLTTHSMEEADAVCSRIGIVTSGSLRCIGSSQHLKNRFSSGYVVTVVQEESATEASGEALDREIKAHFPDAELKEHLGTLRRYGVGKLDSLAATFKYIETKRKAWSVSQYSVTQTGSLEQIFLTFIGHDHEHDEAN